jgi:IS6 family transposase
MVPAYHCGPMMYSKRDGRAAVGQRYRCRACGRTQTDRTGTPFARYRWPREVIVMAVRWYARFRLSRFRLSLRDVRDLLAERGVDVSPSTILAWVHTFGPLLAGEIRRRARPLGRRWYVDETYVRVAGVWACLYRAVDETGQRAREAVEAVQALRRGDLLRGPLPPSAGSCGWTPGEQARYEAEALIRFAGDLRATPQRYAALSAARPLHRTDFRPVPCHPRRSPADRRLAGRAQPTVTERSLKEAWSWGRQRQ